jgi:hypothetical protein
MYREVAKEYARARVGGDSDDNTVGELDPVHS